MDEEGLKIELAAAAGQGIAAITLQQTLLAKLALRGMLAPSEILEIIDIASETVVSGSYSVEEKTIATSALKGVASVWRKPAQRN